MRKVSRFWRDVLGLKTKGNIARRSDKTEGVTTSFLEFTKEGDLWPGEWVLEHAPCAPPFVERVFHQRLELLRLDRDRPRIWRRVVFDDAHHVRQAHRVAVGRAPGATLATRKLLDRPEKGVHESFFGHRSLLC